jgi:hypothetical protein
MRLKVADFNGTILPRGRQRKSEASFEKRIKTHFSTRLYCNNGFILFQIVLPKSVENSPGGLGDGSTLPTLPFLVYLLKA